MSLIVATCPIFDGEAERLAALQSYNILDSLPEQAYDDIVALAAFICQVPIALISFVDKDRQWFKARIGVDEVETSRDLSFCAHAIGGDTLFLVPDAAQDERFRDHPFVAGGFNIRFYAGMPLVSPEGHRLGTICVIDQKPRVVTPEQGRALEALSRQVVNQLELARQNHVNEQLRVRAQETHRELLGLNTILQNAIEGIARVDEEGNFSSLNSRYASAFGYTPQQMIGMPWLATIHPDDESAAAGALHAMRLYGRAELEAQGRRKNGVVCHQQLTLARIRQDDGSSDGFYCFHRDISEQRLLQHHLLRGAYHDPLTDLPNRTYFQETLDHALGRANRNHEYRFAVLFLDLDGFKQVNDQFGHLAGDQVLRETARRLGMCIRPGDVMARLGGDEFAVLLDDLVSLEDAKEVAECMLLALSAPNFWEDTPLHLGVSIGVCPVQIGMRDGSDVIRRADYAMYQAKAGGKNRVHIYDAEAFSRDDTVV